MSDDEIMVLVVSLFLAGWMFVSWWLKVGRLTIAAYPGGWRTWLGWAPVVSVIGVFVVLRTMAAQDVRDAVQYLIMYSVLGAFWVMFAVRPMALMGVSYVDDAIERRNPAAAVLLLCAIAAHTAIYSGANIGDGPGWWVVVYSGFIAASIWYGLWWAILAFTDASERVTVGRETAMAVRLGGWMIGAGIVCGRAAAGDWVSAGETFADFVLAWPAALMAAAAVLVEMAVRGRPERASVPIAAAIALLHVVAAVGWLTQAPPLSENPAYPAPIPMATE